MRIVIHCHPRMVHQIQQAEAFAEGARHHGHDVFIARDFHPLNRDIAVVWGGNPRVNPVVEAQKAINKPYITLERGFFGDRMRSTSIGLNGFNGLADFKNAGSNAGRGPELHKWKSGKELIVIMGQMPGDTSLRGVNIVPWYAEMADEARNLYNKKIAVVYRAHPLDKSGWHPHNAKRIVGSLENTLIRALGIITYSSTSGVDAMVAGVPVMAADPLSMIYNIAPHTVSELKKAKEPDGREQWANDLGYTQWSEEEIRSGMAWEHLGL